MIDFMNLNDFSDDDILTTNICIEELERHIKSTKLRKAPGLDKVVPEHILHGGNTLHIYLQHLFNMMIKCAYIPKDCKIGVIIPIYKEGKPKGEPKSYRPITLLPVIYKLFEKILHERLTKWTLKHVPSFPNPQQNAYQTQLGPTTVSFNLQETISHSLELNSSVHAAFLDTAGAFDNVRHSALFIKMKQLGLNGKILRLLIESYQQLRGCVLVNGVKSSEFQVLQGVRQGGVISTWSYLLFINELLTLLGNNPNAVTMGTLQCGNPTLADDLTVLSYSKASLERQLQVVKRYANHWGYDFNTDKCKLVVFNKYRSTQTIANFGTEPILSCDSVTHVGIQLNYKLNCSDTIETRVRKGRASLFSIISMEESIGDINPITLASIVNKVCIPVTLYGSELWNNLSNTDIVKLERFIRLAAKCIQHMPTYTRTDIALGLLGWYPIETQIDKRKLSFLQKLCVMPSNILSRQIFNLRLNLYALKGFKNQSGFIPDICIVLMKYKLFHYLSTYLASGTFPNKYTWKSIVSKAINSTHSQHWKDRVYADNELSRFRHIHDSIAPSLLWKLSSSKTEIINTTSAIQVLTARNFNNSVYVCKLCENASTDLNRHLITSCYFFTRRRTLYLSEIEARCNSQISDYMKQLSPENFLRNLFDTTVVCTFVTSPELQKSFTNLSTKYIHDVLMKYKYW